MNTSPTDGHSNGFFAQVLRNFPLKSKIALLVSPLILIALYGMGLEMWSVYHRYERAQALERANTVSDYFLKAAGEQAKERGFTSTVLANPQDQKTFSAIAALRKKGDAYLDSGLVLANVIAAKSTVVAQDMQAVVEARTKRDALRTSNDALLGKSSPEAASIKQWIATQSALIMKQHTLAESMFLGESRLESILALNSSIKNSVFYASEFAGRERANIGTVIGSGKPIDAERYASLMQFRGIVQEHCDNILTFRKNPAVTPSIKASIDEMQRVFLTEFETTRKAIYKAHADSLGKPTATYPIATGEWIQRSTKSINAILKVSVNVSEEVAHLAAEERRASVNAVFVALAVAIVLVLVIVLANTTFTLVVARITRLRNVARTVEHGDLNTHIADTTRDEIGELTTSFDSMTTALQKGITDLADEKASVERKVEEAIHEIRDQREYLQASVAEMLTVVERFSQGDLTQHLNVRKNDDIGRLFEGFNRAVGNVRTMMAKIVEETEVTTSASVEITASIENMSQGIQRQLKQSNYIAISTEEMSKTIEETARNTTLVAQQAKEASTEAALGGTSIQKMIEAVNMVNAIVTRSAQSVAHLNSSSEQISEMAASIEEIADQTNLLALNAAIEAARAGEQGRGFAVVADEVRKLAERTQKATKEISGLVHTIQNDTKVVVQSMNQGVREVEETQHLVLLAATSLEKIIARTKSISDFISQLAVTSEEQHVTSEDIASNMEVMTMVVSQSASVSEQIARTSQTLNQMTLTVQHLMQAFTVEKQAQRSIAQKSSMVAIEL
jgi:methyl-accepting chemotaxis protein